MNDAAAIHRKVRTGPFAKFFQKWYLTEYHLQLLYLELLKFWGCVPEGMPLRFGKTKPIRRNANPFGPQPFHCVKLAMHFSAISCVSKSTKYAAYCLHVCCHCHLQPEVPGHACGRLVNMYLGPSFSTIASTQPSTFMNWARNSSVLRYCGTFITSRRNRFGLAALTKGCPAPAEICCIGW